MTLSLISDPSGGLYAADLAEEEAAYADWRILCFAWQVLEEFATTDHREVKCQWSRILLIGQIADQAEVSFYRHIDAYLMSIVLFRSGQHLWAESSYADRNPWRQARDRRCRLESLRSFKPTRGPKKGSHRDVDTATWRRICEEMAELIEKGVPPRQVYDQYHSYGPPNTLRQWVGTWRRSAVPRLSIVA